MPSQRATDAAHIAPYLTHGITHHGQVTLVPPDNAGRVRQAKMKNTRSRRQAQERSPRTEEDLRFNTGPRPWRNLVGNRGARRPGRQEREGYGLGNQGYPDYPPPSFLEATSSSPVSEPYSNGSTLTAPGTSIDSSPILPPVLAPSLPLPSSSHEPFPISPPRRPVIDDLEESDASSLEIIDMDSFQPQPEVPFASSSRLEQPVKRDCICHGEDAPIENPVRGRSVKRSGATLLDLDPDDAESEVSQDATKRRHMSLSPLRTLFPYRPMAVHERKRTLSTHPSPNSSPYSSRSSPFLSATSLKMSMSTTSLFSSSTKTERGESSLSRRLLSFKGKERETSPPKDSESLDTWEFVDSEPSGSAVPADQPTDRPPALQSPPTRSQSLSYGRPVVNAEPPPAPASSPHPLSLRDRKVPPIPAIKRPKRSPPPPPPVIDVPQGPVLTSVRTRKPPPPPPVRKKSQIKGTSPLGHDSWRHSSIDGGPESITSLQQALSTPLPSTLPPTPIDVPPTPVRPEAIIAPFDGPPPTTQFISSFSALNLNDRRSTVDIPRSQGFILPGASFDHPSTHLSPGTVLPTNPGDESSRHVVRRHYPGRPLPRPPGPPGTLRVVDSTYTGHDHDTSHTVTESHCPEGLLIDLEDDSVVEDPLISNPPTPWMREPKNLTSQSYAASSTSSVLLAGSLSDLPPPPLPPRPDASHEVATCSTPATSRMVSESVAEASHIPPAPIPQTAAVERTASHSVPISGASSVILEDSFADPPPPPLPPRQNAHHEMAPHANLLPMPSVANASASPATPTPRDVAIEAAAASRPPPLAPAYSEVTDLDLLVSRIGEAEDRGDGANYDALLLSEFIGPAVSTRPAHESVPPPAPILPVPAPRAPNVPVIGTIQIQRRRTLKDGRTKLKLALMDTAVDKCGICLTQFKSGDIAQLGSVCRHAFHERCLGRWLVHNQTCPMCRVPLERL